MNILEKKINETSLVCCMRHNNTPITMRLLLFLNVFPQNIGDSHQIKMWCVISNFIAWFTQDFTWVKTLKHFRSYLSRALIHSWTTDTDVPDHFSIECSILLTMSSTWWKKRKGCAKSTSSEHQRIHSFQIQWCQKVATGLIKK